MDPLGQPATSSHHFGATRDKLAQRELTGPSSVHETVRPVGIEQITSRTRPRSLLVKYIDEQAGSGSRLNPDRGHFRGGRGFERELCPTQLWQRA